VGLEVGIEERELVREVLEKCRAVVLESGKGMVEVNLRGLFGCWENLLVVGLREEVHDFLWRI
jgi:hypothetical protein